MDYIKVGNDIKLVGQGEAVVLEVKSGTDSNHQVRIKHPDIGETVFIPYIQTSGLFKVPAVGDICYVFMKENFKEYPMAWGSKLHDSAVKALIGARDNKVTVLYSTDSQGNISHKIELDDGTNAGVRISTSGGNTVNMQSDGAITITQKDGATVDMSQAGMTLSVGSSRLTITTDSITMEASGSRLVMDTTVNIKASDELTTIDKVVVSTHDQVAGNLGYPTSGGPTKTGV